MKNPEGSNTFTTFSAIFDIPLQKRKIEAFKKQISLFIEQDDGFETDEKELIMANSHDYSLLQFRNKRQKLYAHSQEEGTPEKSEYFAHAFGINKGVDVLKKLMLQSSQTIQIDKEIFPLQLRSFYIDQHVISISETVQYYRINNWVPFDSLTGNEEWNMAEDNPSRLKILEQFIKNYIEIFLKSVDPEFAPDFEIMIEAVRKTGWTKVEGKTSVALDLMFSSFLVLPSQIGIGKGTETGHGILHKSKPPLSSAEERQEQLDQLDLSLSPLTFNTEAAAAKRAQTPLLTLRLLDIRMPEEPGIKKLLLNGAKDLARKHQALFDQNEIDIQIFHNDDIQYSGIQLSRFQGAPEWTAIGEKEVKALELWYDLFKKENQGRLENTMEIRESYTPAFLPRQKTYKISTFLINDETAKSLNEIKDQFARFDRIEKYLFGNLQTFFKHINFVHDKNANFLKITVVDLMTHSRAKPVYHEQKKSAFNVTFLCNFRLPQTLRLGQSTALGYGKVRHARNSSK